MRRLFYLFLIAFGVGALAPGGASAEKRVALVIGNSAYRNVPVLKNPSRDAEAVANMFMAAGFTTVQARQDLNASEMRRALRDFSFATADADIAVVFYAGHGIEMDGSNYLIPVDALLERDIDVADEGIPMDRILQTLQSVKQLRLVILDACRDNPFPKEKWAMTAKRSLGSGGLAKIEPPSGSNTLVAFAARAGSTAADGDGANGTFTTALLKNLTTPGLDIRMAFGRVRDEVFNSTFGKQEPYLYGSLGGSEFALVQAPDRTTAVNSPSSVPMQTAIADQRAEIRRDFEIAERAGTKEAWDSFLKMYSTGLYADAARAYRGKLLQEPAMAAAVPSPAPIAPSAPERPRTADNPAKTVVAALPDVPVGPPSFDCRTATQADEATVCKSPKLSYLDRELDAAFTALRRTLNEAQRNALRDQQKGWLKQRGMCARDEACLIAAYQSRLAQIKSRR